MKKIDVKRYWNNRLVYWNRDRIILNDLGRLTKKNHVNLHWYSSNREDGKENFGDYLSGPVCEYMLRYFGIDKEKEVTETRHLYAVGSILFWSRQNAVIWGSGLLTYPPEGTYRSKKFHLDIRAVRGPVTRKILLQEGFSCPEVYGDPAILMPYVYMPNDFEKEYDCSIILHKSDKKNVPPAINQIDIMCSDYRKVIDQIVKSKLIISSSLHGIIVAETYGIPSIMLSDTRQDFNSLKYNDYYFSTERYQYPVASSVEEALTMSPLELPERRVKQMRKELKEVFPVDLWD